MHIFTLLPHLKFSLALPPKMLMLVPPLKIILYMMIVMLVKKVLLWWISFGHISRSFFKWQIIVDGEDDSRGMNWRFTEHAKPQSTPYCVQDLVNTARTANTRSKLRIFWKMHQATITRQRLSLRPLHQHWMKWSQWPCKLCLLNFKTLQSIYITY